MKSSQCKDCNKFFNSIDMHGDWCEECFEIGLHKDMNDHWEKYWREEMEKETPSSGREESNEPA